MEGVGGGLAGRWIYTSTTMWSRCASRGAVRVFARAYSERPAPRAGAAPKLRQALLYREVFPPMIKVLAWSTGTYFLLHLTWAVLKNEEEGVQQAHVLRTLQQSIRGEMEK